MPNIHVFTGAGDSPAYPIVRKIGAADRSCCGLP